MTRRVPALFLALAVCTIVAACHNKPAPVSKPQLPATLKPSLMQPFTFHKLVEVSPGQDYDVLSWGRGATGNSAFMILHSDSSAQKFTTTTGDLDGHIVDVFNADMDLDGNPEIIIQAKGSDTVNYTHVYAFEFNDNRAEKLDFPKLTKSQRQGYRGNDNFYIKDGILMREFPVYREGAAASTLPAQKRLLQYGLRNNNFTVTQLTTDSAAVKAVKTTPVQKQEHHNSEKPQASSSRKHASAKKHNSVKKDKTSRRKHHRQN